MIRDVEVKRVACVVVVPLLHSSLSVYTVIRVDRMKEGSVSMIRCYSRSCRWCKECKVDPVLMGL